MTSNLKSLKMGLSESLCHVLHLVIRIETARPYINNAFMVVWGVCVDLQIIIQKPYKLSGLRKLKPFSPEVVSTPHSLPTQYKVLRG